MINGRKMERRRGSRGRREERFEKFADDWAIGGAAAVKRGNDLLLGPSKRDSSDSGREAFEIRSGSGS